MFSKHAAALAERACLVVTEGAIEKHVSSIFAKLDLSPTEHDHRRVLAVLHPPERVALLYCRGRSARQGRGGQLLLALEAEAIQRGCRELRTEASQLSRPLFMRLGWQALEPEQILIAGVAFERYPLRKPLPHERLRGHRPPPP